LVPSSPSATLPLSSGACLVVNHRVGALEVAHPLAVLALEVHALGLARLGVPHHHVGDRDRRLALHAAALGVGLGLAQVLPDHVLALNDHALRAAIDAQHLAAGLGAIFLGLGAVFALDDLYFVSDFYLHG